MDTPAIPPQIPDTFALKALRLNDFRALQNPKMSGVSNPTPLAQKP